MRKFTLQLNAAKNTNYIEKCFKQKLFRTKFPTKKPVGRICLSPPRRGARALISIPVHYNVSNMVIF